MARNNCNIKKVANGFIVSFYEEDGAIAEHVFEEYRSLFDYINEVFGADIPYEKEYVHKSKD